MKKFLGLVLMIAAGVSGFLWWKQKQVIVANEVAADPWPAAVASEGAVQAQAPTDTGTLKDAPAAKKAEAKKAPVKKSPAKKVTPKPPRPSESKPE
ncbi:MAG: hypothetical protein OSA11_08360 [Candidatus Nanopelagicales bacterium]|nr:hypothetical protein [Candidatus Nanopelagicales bacterium]